MFSSHMLIASSASASPSNCGSKRSKDRAGCACGETPFHQPSVSASIVKTLPRNIDDGGHRTKYDSNQGDNHSVLWSMMRNVSITTPRISHPCPVNEEVLSEAQTRNAVILMCLSIGIDPPWLIKPRQYPQREAWIDTRQLQQEPCRQIAQEVEQQYKDHVQASASYLSLPDPTVTMTLNELKRARYDAQYDRVLVHYNGHGVPAPTAHEGLWLFSDDYAKYVTVPFASIVEAVGGPVIGVFDCNSAGVAVAEYAAKFEEAFYASDPDPDPDPDPSHSWRLGAATATSASAMGRKYGSGSGLRGMQEEGAGSGDDDGNGDDDDDDDDDSVPEEDEALLLGACRADEALPMDSNYPADIFTACLTTPVRMAALWFCHHSRLHSFTPDIAERIPGNEKRLGTPLGDLQWTFTMITEAIAFDVLPRATFCRLFRRDSLVASLFSGFLLAERIMRPLGCHPVSSPAIPATYKHRLWDAWDLALDAVLTQVQENTISRSPSLIYTPTEFFCDQLGAFENWLTFGTERMGVPPQLPIIAQIVGARRYRCWALKLLSKYLDLGPWAVAEALSLRIVPQMAKLLQKPASDTQEHLILIWTKLLAYDRALQRELLKSEASVEFFIRAFTDPHLSEPSRVMAAFVLSSIMAKCPTGQRLCYARHFLSRAVAAANQPAEGSAAANAIPVTSQASVNAIAATASSFPASILPPSSYPYPYPYSYSYSSSPVAGAAPSPSPSSLSSSPSAAPRSGSAAATPAVEAAGWLLQQSPMFMQWYAFAFSKLWEGYHEPRLGEECPEALNVIKHLIVSPYPEVRAAAVYACGTFFNAVPSEAAPEKVKEWEINTIVSFQVDDPSPAVRIEFVHALSRFAECYIGALSAYVQQADGPAKAPASSPKSGGQQSPVAQALGLSQPPTNPQPSRRPPSAYFRRSTQQPQQQQQQHQQQQEGLLKARKHASVYMEQSPAGSSAPVSRSSSSASSSSAASMLCPAQDVSFYQFFWNALVGLAKDPQPEVAALASGVVQAVRNYGDARARHARAEEAMGGGGYGGGSVAVSLPANRSGSQNNAAATATATGGGSGSGSRSVRQQVFQDFQGVSSSSSSSSSSISVPSALYERCCEYWRTPIADKMEEDHSSPEYKARERRYRNSVCVYNSAREAWNSWNNAEKKDLSSQLPSLESKPDVVTSSVFFPFESILACATDNQTIK